MSRLGFKLLAENNGTSARATTFKTLHSQVSTPIFMPVGTRATVRGQHQSVLESLEFPILLANTYHLMLRPGPEVFERMGGIQKFMSWSGSVLTDSGGFQIFSLPEDRVITEEGAVFKNYLNNHSILLTPERSIEMQKAIGSDIMMVLDQCIASTADMKEAEAAMHLTHRWAKRSLQARGDSPQSIFGIVQGACFPSLRKVSAEVLREMPFDGFAIGGLAVGESKSQREDMTEFTAALLPKDLPRYLMGVGTPLDLLEAVHRGVDMFDCILPTALGQQGVAFTSQGKVDLRRGAYKYSEERLDESCPCITCTRHSLAYLHHLIRVKENLGGNLIAAHNLHFYARLMREIRESIISGTFLNYYHSKRNDFLLSDRNFPVLKPKKKKEPTTALGNYQVFESVKGHVSVKHIPSGEIMHSTNNPIEEANLLYIQQSRLPEKILEKEESEWVIWDVGLGAGFNAMATLSSYEKTLEDSKENARPLHLVSFEQDLDSFRLALRHKKRFSHLWHGAPEELLEKRVWTSKELPLRWTLLEGNFLDKMKEAPLPNTIYFDPFSLNTDLDAWTLDCFRNIFELCKDHATELFTYSASTAVRALLLASGFFVAKGSGTGVKAETTIALTPKAALESPHLFLPPQWLEKWERSEVRLPSSLAPDFHGEFEKTIRSHPQFSSLQN